MTVLPFLAFALPLAQRHEPQHHLQFSSHRRHPPLSLARATLRVCTDEDCVQQGAYQTLAKLKEEAEGSDIQVSKPSDFLRRATPNPFT